MADPGDNHQHPSFLRFAQSDAGFARVAALSAPLTVLVAAPVLTGGGTGLDHGTVGVFGAGVADAVAGCGQPVQSVEKIFHNHRSFLVLVGFNLQAYCTIDFVTFCK
jgi:hypothetical protein